MPGGARCVPTPTGGQHSREIATEARASRPGESGEARTNGGMRSAAVDGIHSVSNATWLTGTCASCIPSACPRLCARRWSGTPVPASRSRRRRLRDAWHRDQQSGTTCVAPRRSVLACRSGVIAGKTNFERSARRPARLVNRSGFKDCCGCRSTGPALHHLNLLCRYAGALASHCSTPDLQRLTYSGVDIVSASVSVDNAPGRLGSRADCGCSPDSTQKNLAMALWRRSPAANEMPRRRPYHPWLAITSGRIRHHRHLPLVRPVPPPCW